MISDNILKWYTDEIIRSKYNVLGWSLIEKQIKEDKTKLVFETSNTKLSLEFKKLSETTIIFNNIVCKEEVPKTKINGVEYYLEEAIWAEVFDEKLLNKGLELENMTIEEIEKIFKENRLAEILIQVEDIFKEFRQIKVTGYANTLLENGGIVKMEAVKPEKYNTDIKNGEKFRMYNEEGKFRAIYSYDEEINAFKIDKMF